MLSQSIGPIEKLEWTDMPPFGIEADIGARAVTINPDEIVIRHKEFGSKLTIPLK